MITVKVSQVPGPVRELNLETGTTVAEALRLADISSTDGFKITFQGNEVGTSSSLDRDGSLVLAKQVKGNG